MAVVELHKGADIPLTISLTDADGAAINIDNLAELYVFIVLTSSQTIAGQWNKAGSTGYDALRKVTEYVYIADWLSGATKAATKGAYHIEVNIVETDAEYESSEKNTIGSDDIIYLKESKAKVASSG